MPGADSEGVREVGGGIGQRTEVGRRTGRGRAGQCFARVLAPGVPRRRLAPVPVPAPSLQRVPHLPRRRPRGRVLGQAGGDQGQQGARYAVQVRLLVDRPEQDARRAPLTERASPRGRVHQDAAQREDVARRADRRAGRRLFGGEVAGGADHRIGGGEGGGALVPGDPEVDEPGPVQGEEHVAGFHVAVDEPALVDRHQGGREPRPERPYGRGGQGAPVADDLAQRGAGDEGGRQPRFPRLRVGAEHRDHPRPGDPPGGLRLPPEPGPEAGVGGVLGPDHLHGGEGPARRTRQVDHAHAARAEPGQRAVRADGAGVLGGEGPHVSSSAAGPVRGSGSGRPPPGGGGRPGPPGAAAPRRRRRCGRRPRTWTW